MMASQYIDIDELNTLVTNLHAALEGSLSEEASVEATNEAGFALRCYHQFDIYPFWPYCWNEALDGLSLEERQAGMEGLLEALFDLYNRPRFVCSSKVVARRRPGLGAPVGVFEAVEALRVQHAGVPRDFTARHATAPWVDDEDDELPW